MRIPAGGYLCLPFSLRFALSVSRKSLHPALTAGLLPPSSAIHIHSHMHRVSNRQEVRLNVSLIQLHMIFVYIHAFSFNYLHIDSSRGCKAAPYTPVSDFPAEYQWALQGAFEINHSTLLLADLRPTSTFFCPYHIALLLLFMNCSASFIPHILQLSQWICR